MRRLVLLAALLVPPVAQADVIPTTVKRIRTSRNTAINHVRTTPELGRGYQDEANEVHRIKCRGWRILNGRAQVWTCSFHVVDGQKACVAKWKMGREQRTVNGTPESRQWRNTWVSGSCPHP